MEMRHRCKLCHRSFSNGRALGGHMKAHLATLPLPPKPPQLSDKEQLEEEVEEENQLEKAIASYGLRENPKKSSRLADPEFSPGSVIQDVESETESKNQNPTSRRSKRSRSQRPNSAKPSSPTGSSSVSDTCPEEDVAMCLMMLSRDVWNMKQNVNKSSVSVPTKKKKGCSSSRRALKNRCRLCNKVFRSYQAMCGHTKVCCYSYRRKKQTLEEESDSGKVFECPYCDKVFGSGQALGGHKRSHQHKNNNNNNTPPSNSMKNQLIDLNLPPPMELEYDQDDFSVLSDA